MDVLHRLRRAGVSEIREALPEEASYNSVRVTLSILERKGRVRHRAEGRRYVYAPTTTPERARSSALKHLLSTFFQDDASRAVSTLLGMKSEELSDDDLKRIAALIEAEKKRRRR